MLDVSKLVDFDEGWIDKARWGLTEARVETCKGLVFATFDHAAPSLAD